MTEPHAFSESNYNRGICRCAGCTSAHNEFMKAYNKRVRVNTRAMKAELARLQAFEARVLSAVAADGQAS